MIRRPPRSTLSSSSAASDVYKRQVLCIIDLPGFEGERAAQRCVGLLLYASFLWATNPIPAHITALSIPLLAVLLRVCCVPTDPDSSALLPYNVDIHVNNTHTVLGAKEAASMLSSSMFDPVILLFLGGFAIAGALDRYNISNRIAAFLLSSAGTRPSRVLLVLLVMGLIFSGFMSNVAAAVLVTSIISPMVQALSNQTQWPQMALLGVAFSCNIGGMVTPIASPQNLIAVLQIRNVKGSVSFAEWTGFALPSCLVVLGLCWIILRNMFKTNLPCGIEFRQEAPPPVSKKEIFVGGVVGATIVMWILFDPLKSTFGNIGIIAVIPVVIFFGFDLLTKEDFDKLPWNVIILMGGGLALGTAVETSGLLQKIADAVENALKGQGLWIVMVTFNFLMAITANFISSTVSAIIFLPLIAKVGASIGHVNALTVTACMMTSGAMGLPVSSFPNANAYSIRKKDGASGFISNSDLIKSGFLMTGVVFVVIHTCLLYTS
eukprot:TRINITY_DN43612_c0_g2_i2.p1 TRINITY_DN43612_c0_g2~~TRINITY_DN43612_c0_g2_i2.p1  ORF type:complete len:492 (+),score=92.30 TRINITY_DN43612_c0_g2_i2:109-1584(+)